jgi:hypothetical protein
MENNGIILHGLGAHTRPSIESDKSHLVRGGVKYLCEWFFKNEHSIEMCIKVLIFLSG